MGDRAWGVQGHPEVTPDIAAAWAREDSPLLVAAGRRPDELVAEVRDAEAELTEHVAAAGRGLRDGGARRGQPERHRLGSVAP